MKPVRNEQLSLIDIPVVSQDDKGVAERNRIDFSPISDQFTSAPLKPIEVHSPSKNLPSDYAITKHDAFRMGAKGGTGASTFYNIPTKILNVIRRIPAPRGGKLAELVRVFRNDARKLHGHIGRLDAQLNRVLASDSLGDEARSEAAMLAVYFLDSCHDKLLEVTKELRTFSGLLRGGARVGYAGLLVASKLPPAQPVSREELKGLSTPASIRRGRIVSRGPGASPDAHPYHVRKNGRYKAELEVMERTAREKVLLKSALFRISEIGITEEDFAAWKSKNGLHIETTLNNFRGAGCITGVIIQGLITAAINFGLATATMNPIVFAAGAYYATSAAVRAVETAVKTGVQNRLLETRFDAEKRYKRLRQLNAVELFERIHNQTDGLANTGLGVASTFSIPLATGRPSDMTENNLRSYHEFQKITRQMG